LTSPKARSARPWPAGTAHNWSPWLRGAGGRGLSPSLGATLVAAPEATALIVASMVLGRLTRQSGTVTLAGALGVLPLLGWRRRWPGVGLALALAVPMIAKRLAGNGPLPGHQRGAALRTRLLYDRDP
jgi:acyl phosphate:glycerol-3-phosphate acyltransferase